MLKLSQNQKIAISAAGIFMVSLVFMAVFLGTGTPMTSHEGQSNVLNSDGEHASSVQEVKDPETYFRNIAGDSDLPIFVTTPDTSFVFTDPKFCKLLDVKCVELKDQKFVDFVNAKDHSVLLEEYAKLIKKRDSVDSVGPFRVASGSQEKLLLFTAKPIVIDGDVSEIIFLAKDITHQAEDLNETGNSDWMDTLYPRIKELQEGSEFKMMANKIGFTME